jgi:hypothetical protein
MTQAEISCIRQQWYCPMGKDVHINKKPLPESTFPGAPESGVQVFLAAVAMQRQPDPREDNLHMLGRIVKVLE